jgi:hypothetical protein
MLRSLTGMRPTILVRTAQVGQVPGYLFVCHVDGLSYHAFAILHGFDHTLTLAAHD